MPLEGCVIAEGEGFLILTCEADLTREPDRDNAEITLSEAERAVVLIRGEGDVRKFGPLTDAQIDVWNESSANDVIVSEVAPDDGDYVWEYLCVRV